MIQTDRDLMLHPALWQLMRRNARARVLRTARSFVHPRRFILSMLAVLLTAVWIGQSLLGLLFRNPSEPARLALWIPAGMLAFVVWNLLKTIFRQRVEPFEWSETERQNLIASPFSRGQLIQYRVAVIGATALCKAAVFALVMIPDLSIPVIGFAGMWVALMAIEMLRMGGEVAVGAISRRAQRRLRTVAAMVAAGLLATVAWRVWWQWQSGAFTSILSLSGLRCLRDTVCQGLIVWPAAILVAPFRFVTDLMLARSLDATVLARLLVVFGTLPVLVAGLIRLDRFCQSVSRRRERDEWSGLVAGRNPTAGMDHDVAGLRSARFRIPVWGGIGHLVWRQLLGANHYRGQILVALLVPFLLACLPALEGDRGLTMLAKVVGCLVVYTWLLLPTTLKMDFRRDLDRMDFLKSLPTSPFSVVLGQILAPVMIATVFQYLVLAMVMILNPFAVLWMVASVVLLPLVNLIIFGLENLIFLWFPYRLNQEDLQIFLRTILAFTAKSLLFCMAAGLGIACALAARILGADLFASPRTGTTMVFILLAGSVLLITTTCVLWQLTRTFRRIEPGQNIQAS